MAILPSEFLSTLSPSQLAVVLGMTGDMTLSFSNNSLTDVGYNLSVQITIPDGASYDSSTVAPNSIENGPSGTQIIKWTNIKDLSPQELDYIIGLTLKSDDVFRETGGPVPFDVVIPGIEMISTVDTTYSDGVPIASCDMIGNIVNSNGENAILLTPVPDSSSSSTEISQPTITKVVNGYYYKDGTLKFYDVASPGDLIDFTITFDSLALTCDQLDVKVDEYAPLNMGPLVATLPVTYGGTLGTSFTPVTVSPNGLRWNLGDLSGSNLWTATFRVSVDDIVAIGNKNNLAKLSFTNSAGLACSSRDVVAFTFGQPEITFEKTVSPLTNPVRPGELYTYSITVSNPQNIDGTVTDAFNMNLTDVIPTGMTYTGVSSVTGSGTADTPVFSGQDVSILITQLAPDESITLNYQVAVNIGIATGTILTNDAILERPYSQPDNSFQYPGGPLMSSVTKNVVDVTINKTASKTIVNVKDTLTYILTVTVPANVIAYNVVVSDTLPLQQSYAGNAKRNYFAVTPTVSWQTVTFDTEPVLGPYTESKTFIYSFNTKVDSATVPYPQTQTNTSAVNWDTTPTGDPADPITSDADIEVNEEPPYRGISIEDTDNIDFYENMNWDIRL